MDFGLNKWLATEATAVAVMALAWESWTYAHYKAKDMNTIEVHGKTFEF